MANIFTTFIQDRFIRPQVDRQLAQIGKADRPVAYGVSTASALSIREAIGQPHDTDHALLYALYRLHVDVNACVNKWVSGITAVGWRITTMDPQQNVTPGLQRLIDETALWLRNPNPDKVFSILLAELVQNMAISGDAFWNVTRDPKNNRPLEIWPIHPSTTKVLANENGAVSGYVQRVNGREAVRFDKEEVLHARQPNPTNDLYGEPPLASPLEDIGLDLQAMRANRAIFENGLDPSVVILLDENATPEQATELTRRIEQRHQGAGKRHGVMAVSHAKDIKPYSLTLKDMEFTALRGLTTSKVSTAYRIPLLLLGHHNAGDYASSDILYREVHESTFRPNQEYLEQLLTEALLHTIDPDLRFAFNQRDFSNPEKRRGDLLEARRQRIVTRNEVRTIGFGLEPIDGLDEADELTNETPEPGPSANPKPDGDPVEDAPNPSDDADDPEKSVEGRFLQTLHKSWHPSWTSKEAVERAYKAAIEDLRDHRGDVLDSLADSLRPKVVRYFTGQEASYVEKLSEAFKTVRKQSDEEVTGFLSGFGSDDQQLAILLQGELAESAHTGYDEAKLQINFSMGFGTIQPAVEQYLANDALKHARGINATTREDLRASLIDGVKAGEGIDELTTRVKSIFAGAKDYRAATIARTETAQAFEFANQESLRASGVVAQKRWLTARDDRVRPTHQELEGVTVTLSQPFPS